MERLSKPAALKEACGTNKTSNPAEIGCKFDDSINSTIQWLNVPDVDVATLQIQTELPNGVTLFHID